MAYICKKSKGSCKKCPHYRFDEDYGAKACFAAIDEKIEVKNMKNKTQRI